MTTCRATLPILNRRPSPLLIASSRDAILYTTEWSAVVLRLRTDFGYLLLVLSRISICRLSLSHSIHTH